MGFAKALEERFNRATKKSFAMITEFHEAADTQMREFLIYVIALRNRCNHLKGWYRKLGRMSGFKDNGFEEKKGRGSPHRE